MLQRSCYYAWMIAKALDDRKLFEEAPKAWSNGPVFVSLFEAFERSTVSVTAKSFAKQGLNPTVLSDDDAQLAQKVMSLWGERSGLNLNALTTKELPWLEAKTRSSRGGAAELDLELAGSFFRAFLDAPQTATEYANRFAGEYTTPGLVNKPKIQS